MSINKFDWRLRGEIRRRLWDNLGEQIEAGLENCIWSLPIQQIRNQSTNQVLAHILSGLRKL